MPSYADLMAARNPDPSVNRGPIRLWISKGEVRKDAKGRDFVEEVWQEEEVMDTDLVNITDKEEDDELYFPARSKGRTSDLLNLVKDGITSNLVNMLTNHAGALLVLDTNTLLNALPFCTTMFTQCLARNAHAMSLGKFTVSPISFIVPKVVIGELDNLKGRSLTREKAQRANRWILEAIVQQKKRTYTPIHSHSYQTEILPEQAWALHIENHAHHIKSRQDPLYRDETPDDEIVSLCSILQRDSGQAAWLCSDDINAILRAESEGIPTFSVSKWFEEENVMIREGKNESLSKKISEMIDQWSDQMGIQSTNLAGSSQHYEGLKHSTSMIVDSPPTSPSIDSNAAQRPSRQGLSESMHAVHKNVNGISPDKKVSNGFQARSNPSRPQNFTPNTHVYSLNDRSSASSMWASKR